MLSPIKKLVIVVSSPLLMAAFPKTCGSSPLMPSNTQPVQSLPKEQSPSQTTTDQSIKGASMSVASSSTPQTVANAARSAGEQRDNTLPGSSPHQDLSATVEKIPTTAKDIGQSAIEKKSQPKGDKKNKKKVKQEDDQKDDQEGEKKGEKKKQSILNRVWKQINPVSKISKWFK